MGQRCSVCEKFISVGTVSVLWIKYLYSLNEESKQSNSVEVFCVLPNPWAYWLYFFWYNLNLISPLLTDQLCYRFTAESKVISLVVKEVECQSWALFLVFWDHEQHNVSSQTLKHFFVYHEFCEDVCPESLRRKMN